MAMIPNQRTCTLKLTRGEVCKLLVSMAAQYWAEPENRKHIYAIHEKIARQLEAHDEKWKEADECER